MFSKRGDILNDFLRMLNFEMAHGNTNRN